ncbi:MAG: antitoxin family protein [Deltaproteobacteria bacterium]|nr:antitoxin family protein [Deltaproteobacteria bacterium]
MQVQARWEDGVLRPLTPLNLRHAVVTIEVPDDEVAGPSQLAYELSPEAQVIAKAMTAELDEIRAAPLPPDEELPPLSTKQQERMAAFALGY